MGVVDAVIGGFDDSWALFVFGLGTTGIALLIRWWRIEQRPSVQNEEPAKQLYLPPHSSKSPLPMLSISKKKPPQ
jgi:hypothetical protein